MLLRFPMILHVPAAPDARAATGPSWPESPGGFEALSRCP